MKIIDLNDEYKQLYLECLEDWSQDMKEAGSRKCIWCNKMLENGLRVKLALDDNNQVGGMIQYLPIEQSFLKGKDIYFIHCIFVHGYKQGRGNFQKHGMGIQLLTEAEKDAQSRGAKGMAAWGLALPFWMKASWFKKHGYKRADRIGIRMLLYKSFSSENIEPPAWNRIKKIPQAMESQVTISIFTSGWCQALNIAYERAKRVAEELGSKVCVYEYDPSNRNIFEEWGISDGLYVDNKEIRTGPPPSYDKIKKIIKKRLDKLAK